MEKELESYLKKALKTLPASLRYENIIADTIKCALFQWIREKKLIPIPHYRPPKSQEEPLSIVAFDESGKIIYAFAIAPVITLKAIKTFKIIEAEKKFFFTFSPIKKKVEESKFFLTPDIIHLHLSF
ncbi:MAG: hypothetical protein LWW95_08920 [Candidatus Desulfofervidus auxilii]|nr:hypothetical protein [Candidatus Desulfofervidus auxilii]